MSPRPIKIPVDDLAERLAALPGLPALVDALGGRDAHLVGGAVRDLLLGLEPAELDVVVEGDAIALARELDPAARIHERFGTATLLWHGTELDLAGARAETYAAPGALPQVHPADLDLDLARRDFSINAMAVSLDGRGALTDPHGGVGDLEHRVLRVLHARSFRDDPTRALRAARYVARLNLSLESATEELIRAASPASVSADRVEAELRQCALEPDPAAALRLLAAWGLAELGGELKLVDSVLELLRREPWTSLARIADCVLVAAQVRCGAFVTDPEPLSRAHELSSRRPRLPSAGVAAAAGYGGNELVVARALGGEWLEEYVANWRHVRLEIDGDDLIAAGLLPGPAVGDGLAAALGKRLDGEAPDREAQLAAALTAARG